MIWRAYSFVLLAKPIWRTCSGNITHGKMTSLKKVCNIQVFSLIYLTEYISVSAVDWGRQSDEAYEALMAGGYRNDLMTRGEIMTPIMAELAERNVKGASSKTDSAMMRGALRQFSSLVHYY